MSIENKEIQENNKFEKQFENGEITDTQTFTEITNGKIFDENLSKEENFANAFNKSVDDIIGKKLNNIDDETKEKLKELQRQANEGKGVNELVESYKEIKELLNGRDGATGKKTQEHQRLNNPEQEKKENKDKQDFIDELKKAINKNFEKEQEKIEKQKNKINEVKNKEANDTETPPNLEDGWPYETTKKNPN